MHRAVFHSRADPSCWSTSYAAFNSPVWFNVGVEKKPQCSACFINSVDRLACPASWIWPRPRACSSSTAAGGQQPVHPAQQPARRCSVGRWRGQRPRQLHARLRRLRRRHQVGRQDPPRGQDGDPERRASGHRGVHRLQGQRGKEGLGPHRCRATTARFNGEAYSSVFFQNSNNSQCSCVQQRVHARGRGRTANWTTHARSPTAGPDTYKARDLMRKIAEGTASCAVIRACSSTPPSTTGTPARRPTASTPPIPAASTCS
jgi:ribonucleoside-diphosphate reductase alpha chain